MELIQQFIQTAKSAPARIVFPESQDERILRAASLAAQMGIAIPVLLGQETVIRGKAHALGLDFSAIKIVDPDNDAMLDRYADLYIRSRDVKLSIARRLVKKPLSFGGMMVKAGDAEGMVAGVASATASVIQAASLTIGFRPGMSTPSSFFIMIVPQYNGIKNYPLIFADCAVNIDPSARELAEIALASGANARALLNVQPRIAFLSFATKGSANHARVDKVRTAVVLARELDSVFEIDGELQGDAALVPAVAVKKVKESTVAGSANVLVFPDLDSGNIAYKLVQYLAGAKAIGPILQGFASPVNDMSRGASVDDLIAVTAITSIQAKISTASV
ncbi:MAG: phosphate acetyltransferase [Candidatus Neomarinimicrobiota bacterium]